MTAQDRVGRGPFAALLILLSLVLGSVTAAAGADLRGPSTRLGSSRHSTATALIPSPARSPLDEEIPGPGPSLLPFVPGIVTESLPARPGAESRPAAGSAVPRSATASYRARAPPAS
jgi:hypothetical protein